MEDPTAAAAAADDAREVLPDPVLQHVGRYLSLSGMRTCRLVCKRWACVIGESVTAVGAGADALRDAVLRGDGRTGALALGARRKNKARRAGDRSKVETDNGSGSSSSSDDDDGSGCRGSGAGDDADGGGGTGGQRRRVRARAAMRRLRRQSARLAAAFPRAHTAALHVDVGYGDRAAPDPGEAAGRVAALLCGLPNLSRVRLAVRALGADDDVVADDPDAALDADYTFAFTLQFLSCLFLRPPPREARALPPTAAALRRRRAMLPGVPCSGGGGAGGGSNGSGSGGTAAAAAAASLPGALPPPPPPPPPPPCWALELHLGAMPADPAAWGDLAALPQLASLLLPAQQPRVPPLALPALAACTGLRALRLSVAGASSAAGGAGAGVLAEVGGAPAVLGHADALGAQVAELSRLTALTHLSLHCNALPSRPLSLAIAAMTGLRDLFVSGGVPLDVSALVRPPCGRGPGLAALERLALPQPLALGELALLSAHCARLRHVEAAGVWEACLGECAGGCGPDESPIRALLALPPPHAAEVDGAAAAAAAPAGAPGEEADLLAAAAAVAGGPALVHPPQAAGGGAAAAWFHAQLAARAAWAAVLADGWASLELQLPPGPPGDDDAVPTDPWAALDGADPAGPAEAPAQQRRAAAAQVALLVGLTRALHGFSEAPHEAAREAGILEGVRLTSCSYAGAAVSAIAVLAAALASARRGPPGMAPAAAAAAAYDPSDLVTLRGAGLPAGAADRLLDGLHAADPPDPSGGGSDSDSDSDGAGSDGAGGEGGSSSSSDGSRSDGEGDGAGHSCGDDGGSSDAGGGRPVAPARTRRRRHHRAGCAGEGPRGGGGVTSFFTLAGTGSELGPLGAALPRLERLSVALPPSLAGMAAAGIANNAEWPSSLPELVLSFCGSGGDGGSGDGSSSNSRRGSNSSSSSTGGGGGDGQQPGGDEAGPLPQPRGAVPAAPPLFPRLRHLSIGGLTAPGAQFDPACAIGDAVLRAVAAGLPALETLQLDGELCLTGAGVAHLSALMRLRSLAMHHWTDTLLPLRQQLVRVPALCLPPGLTALRAINVQLDPPHAAAAAPAGKAPPPHDAPLARVFGRLVTLELLHGDHAAADRLLDLALPHAAGALEALHVSGPCGFHHTPSGAALAYGAAFGAEAATGFLLPLSQLLAGLRARRHSSSSSALGGGQGGTTWLRHIAGLRALSDLHIDAPLASPAQVRELVDALVRRGGVHTLAVHGLTVSLVTRRGWLVRQLARLPRLGLMSVSISFGRHALAVVPGWLRRGGGGGGAAAQQHPEACPADVRMLEELAAAFKTVPDAHFTIATDDGTVEESAHTVPWGLPLPAAAAGAGGGGGGAAAAGGPIAEGAEAAAGAAAAPPPQEQHGHEDAARLPRGLRALAVVLAFCIGPRNAVEMLSRALVAGGGVAAAEGGAEGGADAGGGVPAAWGVHALVVDAVAPWCEDRVGVPDAVLSRPSTATAAFCLGAAAALAAVALFAGLLAWGVGFALMVGRSTRF